MSLRTRTGVGALLLAGCFGLCGSLFAAERVTLRNGFELDCVRQEAAGDRVRLYLVPERSGDSAAPIEDYIEVNAAEIARTEPLELAPVVPREVDVAPAFPADADAGAPTAAEMEQLLTAAGAKHNVDADLLASVVRAESGGQAHAVSRAGAKGLMQLMPSTAADLGVKDAFAADQNIGGGTAYLDQLLTRYHDNVALALAAYNAGPAAVDRYRGVPPYAETRAYVARVIREFNRRKTLARAPIASSNVALK